MVLIVCGVAILAGGVHYASRYRVPAGAVPLDGRVIDVVFGLGVIALGVADLMG